MSTKALLLSGGYGTRLSPLTDIWPKCLMPIKKKPLLEFWIDDLKSAGIEEVLINLHHLSDEVICFLERKKFKGFVKWVFEDELLGTAGTLKKNADFFKGGKIFLAHADNFCTANLEAFINAHHTKPSKCIATMMTFLTETPESCGVVALDSENTLLEFYEKVPNPPSNLANAAVYMLDEEMLDWISDQTKIYDFSTEVVPKFLGRIKTWHNENIHIDIGTIKSLIQAQSLNIKNSVVYNDHWHRSFLNHPIHELIDQVKGRHDRQ